MLTIPCSRAPTMGNQHGYFFSHTTVHSIQPTDVSSARQISLPSAPQALPSPSSTSSSQFRFKAIVETPRSEARSPAASSEGGSPLGTGRSISSASSDAGDEDFTVKVRCWPLKSCLSRCSAHDWLRS